MKEVEIYIWHPAEVGMDRRHGKDPIICVIINEAQDTDECDNAKDLEMYEEILALGNLAGRDKALERAIYGGTGGLPETPTRYATPFSHNFRVPAEWFAKAEWRDGLEPMIFETP